MRTITQGDTMRIRLKQAGQVRTICENYGLKKILFRQVMRGHGITVDYDYRFQRWLESANDSDYEHDLIQHGNGIRVTLQADNVQYDDEKSKKLASELLEYAKLTKGEF